MTVLDEQLFLNPQLHPLPPLAPPPHSTRSAPPPFPLRQCMVHTPATFCHFPCSSLHFSNHGSARSPHLFPALWRLIGHLLRSAVFTITRSTGWHACTCDTHPISSGMVWWSGRGGTAALALATSGGEVALLAVADTAQPRCKTCAPGSQQPLIVPINILEFTEVECNMHCGCAQHNTSQFGQLNDVIRQSPRWNHRKTCPSGRIT